MPNYYISGEVLDSTGSPQAGVTVRAYSRSTGVFLAADVSSDGNPIIGDPYFSNVVLLANFDEGAIDKSNYAHPLVFNGGGVSTVQKAFDSGKSMTGVLSSASAAEWALPGDFTFETEFWITSWSPGMQTLFNIGSYGNIMFRLQSTLVEVWINGGATNIYLNGGAAIPTATWHHIAITREAGVIRVWFNGVKCGNDWTHTYSVPMNTMLIGASAHAPSTEYVNGYLDEVRLTKGVARYSANFTRPAAPHKPFADKAATPYGSFTIALGDTDPGECQVVFVDPADAPVQNDVIHRTIPYSL